jgi:hypothetical protein
MANNNREPSSSRNIDNNNTLNDPDSSREIYFDVQQSDPFFREQDAEVNLDSLITAPMVAVSKANSIMLSGQVQFILDYCFNQTEYKIKDSSGQITTNTSICYEPKMVNLIISQPNLTENPNNEKSITSEGIYSIPILTLLPINSLGIDKMKVDFSMDITSISSYKDQRNNSQERKSQLSGKLSGDQKNQKGEVTNSSKNLSVFVEASKLPLPNGILNIIDMYSKISNTQN